MQKRKIKPTNRNGEIYLNLLKPLLPFMEDKSNEDIVINEVGKILVQKSNNTRETFELPELTKERIINLIIVASNIGTRGSSFSQGDKGGIQGVSTILPINKFRFSGEVSSGIEAGFYVSIRLNDEECYPLTSFGLTKEEALFLSYYVESQGGFMVCGATGSGKTSLCNSLLKHIKPNENVIMIGDLSDLIVDTKAFYYAKTQKECNHYFNLAMRSNPSRIIVPELTTFNTGLILRSTRSGHGGFVVTLHCGSLAEIEDVFIKNMRLAGNANPPSIEDVRADLAGIGIAIFMQNKKLVDIRFNNKEIEEEARKLRLFKFKQAEKTSLANRGRPIKYNQAELLLINKTFNKLQNIRKTAERLNMSRTVVAKVVKGLKVDLGKGRPQQHNFSKIIKAYQKTNSIRKAATFAKVPRTSLHRYLNMEKSNAKTT